MQWYKIWGPEEVCPDLFYSAAEKDTEDDNGLQLQAQNIALLQDIQMPFWDALTGIKYGKWFFYLAWH